MTVKIIRTLSNGVEIPEEDDIIWHMYGDRCVMCVYQLASCLHEAPPKSRNKNWKNEPWNRFPVCNQHHEQLHNMNLKVQLALLTNQRNAYFPHAEEQLRKYGT